jgi:tetratricopeptide (TPR) repeat protein
VAQALFDDGRELMTQKRYHEACAKFEESNRLDPAMGTQYNLADCYDFIGRYTRAWILFVDVAAAARAGGERDREAAARSRAAKLEPRLTKLRVVVDDPVPGLTVHLGERELPAAQWGTALPIEGGDYTLRAAAPGYRDWRRVVRVEGQGVTEEANVPGLEPAAATCAWLRPSRWARWPSSASVWAPVRASSRFERRDKPTTTAPRPTSAIKKASI